MKVSLLAKIKVERGGEYVYLDGQIENHFVFLSQLRRSGEGILFLHFFLPRSYFFLISSNECLGPEESTVSK